MTGTNPHQGPHQGRIHRTTIWLLMCLVLAGCQGLPSPISPPAGQGLGPRLDDAVRVIAAPASSEGERTQAESDYRRLVADHLPALLQDASRPERLLAPDPDGAGRPVTTTPDRLADLTPVLNPRVTVPGLHRTGLGLPMVGRVFPGGANAPRAGFQVPLTLVALPQGPAQTCCAAALIDPERLGAVPTRYGEVAVAMDLEAPIDATKATGPGRRQGLTTMLRPERFAGRPRIVFLQPFDPEKVPVVLVHGLMSTPRIWAPLVKSLLADAPIRDRYQFWFFYYPTSQPIPLSALQLREALDAAVRIDHPRRPMILVGHSMGGILARAQVSRITATEAERISPGIAARPATNPVRRALIFEPRRDIGRVVFMFTPHRGSRIASNRLGLWGKRLTRLPRWLINEVAHYAHLLPDAHGGRLPTSIHNLAPHSRFLRLLDETRPIVPVHSIIGARRSGPMERSSDGVVAYRSAHLATAESELVIPAGHSGTAHPQAIAELRRILLQAIADDRPW